MAEITAAMVKELREQTGAGMMDVKRALTEAGGNMEEATKILRKKGLAAATKKAGRVTSEGAVAAYSSGNAGVLVEVNCETDFVARTDDFRALVREIAMQVAAMNPSRVSADQPSSDGQSDVPLLEQAYIRDPSKTIKDLVHEGIAKLGENIVVRRFARFELGGQ